MTTTRKLITLMQKNNQHRLHSLPPLGVALLTVAFFTPTAPAAVILSSSLGANSYGVGKVIDGSNTVHDGAGIAFTTGSGSAWDLSSITLPFTTGTTGTGTYGGGTVQFSLYSMTSGDSATTAGSLTFIGSTSLSLSAFSGSGATSASQKTFDLSAFDDLAAGQQYLLGIDVTGNVTGATNNFLKLNATATAPAAQNASGWSVASGYSYMVNTPVTNGTFDSSTTSVNYSYVSGGTAPNSSVGFGFELSAAAVPEPGTWSMLLGGMALAIAVNRRRKTALALPA